MTAIVRFGPSLATYKATRGWRSKDKNLQLDLNALEELMLERPGRVIHNWPNRELEAAHFAAQLYKGKVISEGRPSKYVKGRVY